MTCDLHATGSGPSQFRPKLLLIKDLRQGRKFLSCPKKIYHKLLIIKDLGREIPIDLRSQKRYIVV